MGGAGRSRVSTANPSFGLEAEPEALQASVALRIARGEPAAATALLKHRLDELGWTTLRAAPPSDVAHTSISRSGSATMAEAATSSAVNFLR